MFLVQQTCEPLIMTSTRMAAVVSVESGNSLPTVTPYSLWPSKDFVIL